MAAIGTQNQNQENPELLQIETQLKGMLADMKNSFYGILGFSEEDLIRKILEYKFKKMMPFTDTPPDENAEEWENTGEPSEEEQYNEKIKGMVDEAVSSACSEFVNSIKANLNTIGADLKVLPSNIATILGSIVAIGSVLPPPTTPSAPPLLLGLATQISDLINRIMEIISLIIKLGLPLFMPIISIVLPLLELLKSLQKKVLTDAGYPEIEETDWDSIDSLIAQLEDAVSEPEEEPEEEPEQGTPDTSGGDNVYYLSIQGRGEDIAVNIFNSNYLDNLVSFYVDGQLQPSSASYTFQDYDEHEVILVFDFQGNLPPSDLFATSTVTASSLTLGNGSTMLMAAGPGSHITEITLPGTLEYLNETSISGTGATTLTLQSPPPVLLSGSLREEFRNLENITIPNSYRLLYQANEEWSNILSEVNANGIVMFSDGTRWEPLSGSIGGSNIRIVEKTSGIYPALVSDNENNEAGYIDSVTINASTGQISATSFSGSGEYLTGVMKRQIFTNQELQPDSDNVATWIITHTLGTEDVVCSIRNQSTKREVFCEIEYVDEYTITVRINTGTNIPEDTLKAVLIG